MGSVPAEFRELISAQHREVLRQKPRTSTLLAQRSLSYGIALQSPSELACCNTWRFARWRPTRSRAKFLFRLEGGSSQKPAAPIALIVALAAMTHLPLPISN